MTEAAAFTSFMDRWIAQKKEAGLPMSDDEFDCAEEAWRAAMAYRSTVYAVRYSQCTFEEGMVTHRLFARLDRAEKFMRRVARLRARHLYEAGITKELKLPEWECYDVQEMEIIP